MTVGFKVVAIDLDGTLFNHERGYDHERFTRMLDACHERGIRVVIASGRQYLSMRTMFDEPDRLAFVGDNGSIVVDVDHQEVAAATLDPDVTRRVVELLDGHPEVCAVVSGVDRAWMPRDAPRIMQKIMPTAYDHLVLVDSLHQIDGPVVKFALTTDEGQSVRLAEELSAQLGGGLVPVTTGHRGIDLIDPSRHKAYGLSLLLERWGLGFDDLLAFGDSGNDVEMLQAAGTSYAMANGGPKAHKAAQHEAPSSDESGVMVVVEQLLGLPTVG